MELVLYEPSKWKTWIVTFLCLSGISVSSYYLQKDISSFSFDRGFEWGKVTSCSSDAKRRHSDSYLWSRIGSGDTVFRKDSVRVGPKGFAQIQLSNGTKIELGANSLVTVEGTKTLTLKFVRGNFIVADGKGERAVSVTKGGVAIEREVAVRLLSPAPGARIFSGRGELVPVKLTWESTLDGLAKSRDGARILVSQDRNFQSAGTISQPIETMALGEWNGFLAPGHYYWKILAANENLSEVRSFTIVPVDPLVPLAPSGGDTLLSFAGQRTVNFRWVPPRDRDEERDPIAELELARDANFNELVRSETVDSRTGAASVDGLEAGSYFWRLRSQYGGTGTVSRVSAFNLKTRDKLDLSLHEPADGATYEVGRPLRFSWDVIEGNFEYIWEIEEASDPARPEAMLSARGVSTNWTATREGKFRWRVSARFAGEVVGVSAWRTLRVIEASIIELLRPHPQEKVAFWEGQWKVPFKWAKQSGDGERYRVKISEDLAFTRNVVSFVTEKTEWDWTPATTEGGYRFWKVEWLGKGGEVVRFSDERRFFFGVADLLPPPIATAPENGAEFSLNDMSKDPELEWEKVENALAYDVVVERNGKVWQHQLVEKGTTLKLPRPKPGSYTWTVQAIDRLKRKGAVSSLHPFIVRPGDKLKAPTKTEWEVE